MPQNLLSQNWPELTLFSQSLLLNSSSDIPRGKADADVGHGVGSLWYRIGALSTLYATTNGYLTEGFRMNTYQCDVGAAAQEVLNCVHLPALQELLRMQSNSELGNRCTPEGLEPCRGNCEAIRRQMANFCLRDPYLP